MNQAKLQTLLDMHEYCRPMGSKTEQAFIDTYISVLPNAEQDKFGNWHVTVSDDPILWSCHTDTVHHEEGLQRIHYSRKTGILKLAKNEKISNCLGADCTAGVFLMTEMIKAKVPGHYVFHYGEEHGCVGSRKLALHYADWLKQFTFAIALDRGGTGDIITHQAFGRTASDEFALSMAAQLGGFYEPCDGGIYTDTNEYAALIAECSNISVGMAGCHSKGETLDVRHLFKLLRKLLALDVSKLVSARDPKAAYVFDDDRDFISADWWVRDNSLTDDERALLGDNLNDEDLHASIAEGSYNDYLDPIFASVQRELVRELKLRQGGRRVS